MRCALVGRLTGTAGLEQVAQSAVGVGPAALVAAAYRRVGEKVLELCEGEFSLALWDADARRGLLARDPLGQRSIYLARRGRTLLFADEVRPLLGLLPARPAPDPVAVAHWLGRTGIPNGRTLHEGIERLAPGHLVELGAGSWRTRPYWKPAYSAPRITHRSEAREALAGEMAAAVTRSLEGSSAAALLLSGGFDSGSIAALAARGGRRLATYSAVFPDHPDIDESERISRVRGALGLAGIESRFAGGSALAPALEFLLEHEMPSVSPNALVWRPLVRKAAADGVDVVLDGEGGDEVLGCSPFLIADLVAAGRLAAALRTVRRLPGMGDDPPRRWVGRGLRHYGLRGALPHGPHGLLRSARAGRGAAGWLRPEMAQIHADSHDPWAWKRLDAPRWWSALVDAVTRGSEALGAADQQRRESTLTGAPFRHPYRDPRLLELVLGLAPELMFDPDLDRPLARAAVAPLLPRSIVLGERKPHFNAILDDALCGADAESIRAILDDPRSEVGAYVDLASVRRDLATGRDPAPRARSLDLWRVLTLDSWLRLQDGRERVEELGQTAPTRQHSGDTGVP